MVAVLTAPKDSSENGSQTLATVHKKGKNQMGSLQTFTNAVAVLIY